MQNWNQFGKTINLTTRLADLVLRTQRIVISKRIDQLQAMVQIHAPEILKQPDGQTRLKKIKQEFERAKVLLRKVK